MPDLEIHYSGEWAALYVNGELERVGDSYLAEERAFEILGVKVVHDDAYMQGQETAAGVARTLGEVETYRADREQRRADAARMREEAERLLAAAKEMEDSR